MNWKEIGKCTIGFVLFFGLSKWSLNKLYTYDSTTQAEVLNRSFNTVCSRRGCSTYSFVDIRFVDMNGNTHETNNLSDSNRNDKQITVYYNSKQPSQVTTESKSKYLSVRLFFLSVLYLIGYYLYYFFTKPKNVNEMTIRDLQRYVSLLNQTDKYKSLVASRITSKNSQDIKQTLLLKYPNKFVKN